MDTANKKPPLRILIIAILTLLVGLLLAWRLWATIDDSVSHNDEAFANPLSFTLLLEAPALLLVGVGLLLMRNWARIVAIVFYGLVLVGFGIGILSALASRNLGYILLFCIISALLFAAIRILWNAKDEFS